MESSRTEDLLLSREQLELYDNSCCDIYSLTPREVCLIYSCIRFADWDARWLDRDRDGELVETIKRKLLMLCVKDLVKAQLITMGALTGREIYLPDDASVEAFLGQVFDFSEDGVVPAIVRLSGATGEDYSDELMKIATILGAVA